jgi:hypothetical protein
VELVLRNKEIIKTLDYVVQKATKANIEEISKKRAVFAPDDALRAGEKYLTEEYLFKHMNDPDHQGYPVEHASTPFSSVKTEHKYIEQLHHYANNDFVKELGANENAVFLYYPPGGFVGWHTNQNNPGYQFIFSWSKEGDGYFQYYDKQKQEIIKLPDKAGWQARCYHFGEEEPDHCWHSAYTNVPRITICVLFRWRDKPEMKDQILAMKDQLIEEIESED